jgi:ABC-type multidrug transport system ATPase subunit
MVREIQAAGGVLSRMPYVLKHRKPVGIGSAEGREIRIAGIDPHHAELRWNSSRGTWMLYDDPAPGKTCLNGREVGENGAELQPDDRIEIAGVCLRYDGHQLSLEGSGQATGVCVRIRVKKVIAGKQERLRDVSFDAPEGTFTVLLGPSGCGKSTLLQRIAGLGDYEGQIRFNGHEMREGKETLRQYVAYLPQAVEATLHEELAVGAVLEDYAQTHLAAGVPDWAEVLKEVELISTEELLKKRTGELSGGQKRRLALAMELLRKPKVLLLDEPTAGLDPAAAAGIMKLLRKLANQGRTVLCSTHVLFGLERCHQICVLASMGRQDGGRQVFCGTPKEMRDWVRGDKGSGSPWIPRLLKVYSQLQEGVVEASPEVEEKGMPVKGELPEVPAVAGGGRAFRGTWRRLLLNVCSKSNLALFLGIPAMVGLVLGWACGRMFGEGGDQSTVCFCLAVAAFWLGLSGTVRGLVSERVPKRCLDWMRGVPSMSYFGAHVAQAWTGAAVQSGVLAGVVFWMRSDPVWFAWEAMPVFWWVLGWVAFAGGVRGAGGQRSVPDRTPSGFGNPHGGRSGAVPEQTGAGTRRQGAGGCVADGGAVDADPEHAGGAVRRTEPLPGGESATRGRDRYPVALRGDGGGVPIGVSAVGLRPAAAQGNGLGRTVTV